MYNLGKEDPSHLTKGMAMNRREAATSPLVFAQFPCTPVAHSIQRHLATLGSLVYPHEIPIY